MILKNFQHYFINSTRPLQSVISLTVVISAPESVSPPKENIFPPT